MSVRTTHRRPIGAGPADVGRRILVRHRDTASGKPDEVSGVLDRWTGEGMSGILRIRQRDGFMVRVVAAQIEAVKVIPPEVSAAELDATAEQTWLPVTALDLGDWRLRWSGGLTGRGNSVRVGGTPDRDPDAAAGEIRRWYAQFGSEPMFQAPYPSIHDEFFERQGWPVRQRLVMLVNATSRLVTLTESAHDRSDVTVSIDTEPDDEWWSLVRDYDDEHRAELDHILTASPDTVFASCRSSKGDLLGIGRAGLVGGWVGATSMETHRNARRRGVATSIMAALARWSQEFGAERWFLQVRQDASAALSLYDALGFTEHHRYVYRAPEGRFVR